jgi:type III secretion system YscD/HrpQ family protein
MDSAASRQLLKVLSGPHAGGEVLLADGEYVIGSDDSSEIVLTDDYVAPRHARLSVRAGSVTCQGLDGARIHLEGAGTDGAQLAPFQCFTLGATHLAIGPAEAKWPAVNVPTAPVQVDLPPVPAAAPTHEPAGEDALQVAAEAVDKPAADVAPAAAPIAAAATPAAKPANRGLWAAVVGFVAALAALFAFVAWLALSEPPAVPVVSREVQQAALQNAIAKLGFGESVTVTDQANRFVVAGHVATPADKRAVREAVLAIDRATRLRIHDAQTLLATVKDMLRMNRLDFTAAAGKPGEIVVGGLLRDADQWARVRQRILTDMPQLTALTEDFANVPKATVESGPEDEATADAETPADPEPADPAEVAAASGQSAATPSLPPIQSISVGNTRFITLANGEHVFRGAVLASGYTVKEIEADRVVLARGASVHIIKIGI